MQTPVAPLSTTETPAAQLDGTGANTQPVTNENESSADNTGDSISGELGEAPEDSSAPVEDAAPVGSSGLPEAGRLDKN